MKCIKYMRVNHVSRINHNSTLLKKEQLFDNLMKRKPLFKKFDVEKYLINNLFSTSLKTEKVGGGVL